MAMILDSTDARLLRVFGWDWIRATRGVRKGERRSARLLVEGALQCADVPCEDSASITIDTPTQRYLRDVLPDEPQLLPWTAWRSYLDSIMEPLRKENEAWMARLVANFVESVDG